MDLKLEPESCLSALRHTQTQVRILVPNWFDRESLALDILMESWENGHTFPSVGFIRQRCIDAGRKQQRENNRLHEVARLRKESNKSEDLSDPETINKQNEQRVSGLMKCLTPIERQVIFLRFYVELSVVDSAKELSISAARVRDILSAAIYKMREETQERKDEE